MKELTLEIAKTLQYGTILYMKNYKNFDGTPRRWKVNGKIKLWKRSPNRIRIPVKHGLYNYDYIDENNINEFMID
jgi:hypothetical protein